MEQFNEKTITYTEIKVVKGTITSVDNELFPEYDLFYWANFIPHFNNKKIKIIGECGFDTIYEKTEFEYNYDIETDTLTIPQPYRITLCSEQIYNRYANHIFYNDNNTLEENWLPWIRFPRTKDGILLPELIENIFGKIPNKIIFH